MPCHVFYLTLHWNRWSDLGIETKGITYRNPIQILVYADDTGVLKEAIINLSEAVRDQSAKN
jgi:hypothetical protein